MGSNPSTIPSFLIAGTHSGVGKTTVTLGLMAALKRRGLRVQPFKVGPDFIDPTHHSQICGRPSRNLDTFMMGAAGVQKSYAEGSRDADVSVVEGVMGLFDGIGATDEASTAQVARVLDLPVVLVVNVHGASRSVAALVKGFSTFDPGLRIAGLLLNQVGSPRHGSSLQEALEPLGVPVLGFLPRRPEISLKSRHLGLEMAFESRHDLEALSGFIEENVDLDRMLELEAPLPQNVLEQEDPLQSGGGVRIGVAMDEAFCFYYYDNIQMLRRLGAEVVPFSPLHDRLPDVDGVYLGGGYPELHAAALEAGACRIQIREAAQEDMPVYGECGGLMYMGREVVLEERSFEMAGILPATTIMTKKLQALGYVEAEAVAHNPVAAVGSTLRGHEFHYSRVEVDRDANFAYRLRRGKGIMEGRDGLVEHNSLGGYLHAHFYSHPFREFVDGCRARRRL
ncbi:MAG: cobyrinate a,c-diamide synthase [Methanosarcinales archaeon]|nr:cobyrinate a,c-diamide synthase [Methanosarcinales archaeon]